MHGQKGVEQMGQADALGLGDEAEGCAIAVEVLGGAVSREGEPCLRKSTHEATLPAWSW